MNCSRAYKIIVVHDITIKEIFNYNLPGYLTFWRRNYFFNFSTPSI